jgi:hypothetical protein
MKYTNNVKILACSLCLVSKIVKVMENVEAIKLMFNFSIQLLLEIYSIATGTW